MSTTSAAASSSRQPPRVEWITCPTPRCGKPLLNGLRGTAIVTCRYCKKTYTITR